MNKKEIWKDIKGYEGLYQVSNLGRVKSLERTRVAKYDSVARVREKILKPGDNTHGYSSVILRKDNKHKIFKVHRLVAETFIPNPLGLKCVNHISEDKSDCSVDNLEWCDHKYNNNYGTRNSRAAKSRKHKRREVLCIELNKIFKNMTEAAREVGCTSNNIRYCLIGHIKTASGYTWRYVEE